MHDLSNLQIYRRDKYGVKSSRIHKGSYQVANGNEVMNGDVNQVSMVDGDVQQNNENDQGL